MMYRISIEDSAVYEFNSADYSKEEAINEALNWFDERKPHISVEEVPDSDVPRWAVVNPDGTYAGVPCWTEEAARELACQREGRRIFQMAYDPAAQILWS